MSRDRRGTSKTDNSEDDPNKLWCICQTPYNPRQFMICCDICDEWYHGQCVGITEEKAKTLDYWYCDRCIKAGKAPPSGERQLAEQAPKKQKNIREEVVKHMAGSLEKAYKKCRAVVDQQLANKKAVSDKGEADGADLTDEEFAQLEQDAKKLVEYESKIQQIAQDWERGIFEHRGAETDKPYRNQYRGLKRKLDSPAQHAFRLAIFTGAVDPVSLGAEDVSAFVDH